MTQANVKDTPLKWELLIKKRGSATQGVPPGKESLTWVANTVTLLHGERDAVLVDTFLTDEHTRELVDWIVASGKNLTKIYVTHAHPDHFFGLKMLLDRFPKARAIAPAQVVKAMHDTIAPEVMANNWNRRWPGQIPEHLVTAEVLDDKEFELEGRKIVVVDTGHTDTDHTTCLHVPSIDLVIAGDAVYNGTHPFLVESNREGRRAWLAALDTIEALKPRTVIVGHGVLHPDNDPRHIEETRRYIRDFNRLDESTTTARELYDKMLELYPDRINPGSLWGSANAAKAVP